MVLCAVVTGWSASGNEHSVPCSRETREKRFPCTGLFCMSTLRSADVFCRVIDNFGDAGVCWRLARALSRHGLSVRLWIDDLPRLRRLRPTIDTARREQPLDGFIVVQWDEASPDGYVPADLVIEAFACRMPEPMLDVLARTEPRRAWINLEYLSAESWVKGSHALPSPHPRLPLTQHFYFPGFEPGLGGLLREPDVRSARAAFDAPAREDFLARFGIARRDVKGDSLLVSMFCYPHAPLDALLTAMQSGPRVTCLVPEGVAGDVIARRLERPALPGERLTGGNLTLVVVPFLEPDDYDRLLWSCDLNFVRGEDSLVRAHWAERPFIWQLYPQSEGAQQAKLEAFLDISLAGMGNGLAARVRSFAQWWNADSSSVDLADWSALCANLPEWESHACHWAASAASAGELSRSMIEFASKIR